MTPRIGALRPPLVFTAVIGIVSAAAALWLSGCNLFSPLAADADKDLTYRGLLLKGNAAINDGDYAEALDYFTRAKEMNPRGSEGYLFQSKALVSLYKIDYDTLNKEFRRRRGEVVDGQPPKTGIPFIDSGTTLAGIDSIYYPVAQSVENLEHILRRERDTILVPGGVNLYPDGDTAGDGRVTEGVARLDLGLLQTIKGMLGPLDLDGNNRVDAECGVNLCPGRDAACMAGEAYRRKCREGLLSEAAGFERFKNLVRSIDINNPSTKDIRARQLSSNPNDINDFLDKMSGPIGSSSFNLDSVTGSMNAHGEGQLSGQLTEIVTNVQDLSNFLAYMRFNDNLDNDFDDQDGSGQGVRMVWHDYDKDNAIHWDYDDDDRTLQGYAGAGANGEARNLGHPLHRRLHPELYVKFTDGSWTMRKTAGDTSKNARKAAMIKHCQDAARTLSVDGLVTQSLIDDVIAVTCSTYTSFIKSTVRPPAKSDWRRGSAGIDEEMIDEHDNDYDGLTDEDARNAPGMDDDDDAQLNVSMIGADPSPMSWSDADGHGNSCPDIDVDAPMPPPPMQRKFCIGSLEHRIHLAQQGGKDTLKLYYSGFLGEGGDRNCLEDFQKLPQAYKDLARQESPTDKDFANAIDDACQFKHIWIRGIPSDSEWKAGVFGVDEELPDGIDNDGDGWIDEDLK
jgi:tetratricopeptide (TPR) repeat protein